MKNPFLKSLVFIVVIVAVAVALNFVLSAVFVATWLSPMIGSIALFLCLVVACIIIGSED